MEKKKALIAMSGGVEVHAASKPAQVKSVTANDNGKGTITISWKKVKGVTLILSIKYLISFISFDLKNPHSEILCKRSIESIGKIFSNKNIHLIPNEEMSKIILSAINMIVPIIKQRTNNEILSYMIKNKKEDNKYMWNYIIDNLLYNILEPILFDLKIFIIFDKIIIFLMNY